MKSSLQIPFTLAETALEEIIAEFRQLRTFARLTTRSILALLALHIAPVLAQHSLGLDSRFIVVSLQALRLTSANHRLRPATKTLIHAP
jgi:hypothetical protein